MLALSRSVLVCLLLVPAAAFAKHKSEFVHTYEQVWGSAVRMIRVDYGFPIRDRDEEIGFILFEYKDGERKYPGSMEIVRIEQDGRPAIRVVTQINGMPKYVERMMLDKLKLKLRTDFGVPIDKPIKKPAEPPADEPPADDVKPE